MSCSLKVSHWVIEVAFNAIGLLRLLSMNHTSNFAKKERKKRECTAFLKE
jgi:hypothetical protein